MADISKITVNSTTYNLRDSDAVKTVATTSANGLMSSSDKTKLDSLPDLTTSVKTVTTTKDTTLTNSATWYSCCSLSLEAGTWILVGDVGFSNKSTTTLRSICIHSSVTQNLESTVQVAAISGYRTFLNTSRIVTLTSTTTFYLNACSYTASTVISSGYATLKAIRLK